MTYANLSWNRTFDNNKKYVWVTESGSNVCDVCKSLNGKVFSGNKIPPKPHPNCRCAIMEEPVYKNYQVKLKEIKNLIEIYAVQQTERLLSDKERVGDILTKKVIRANRFEIRQKVVQKTINTVHNDLLENQKINFENIERNIKTAIEKRTPVILEKFLITEKQKADKIKTEIRKSEEDLKEANSLALKVVMKGTTEGFKNTPKELFKKTSIAEKYQKIRHETASKVLKDLEVTCPPEVAGRNKQLAKYLLLGGSKIYQSPNAEKLTLIGMNDIDKDYLKNVKVYNKIEDLKQPKLKKTIKSLIKEDNELYKKYAMPAIENCKTYWFNEKHELAEIIARSQAIKNFIRENKKINPSDERPAFIEFKNGIDTDLYYAIHNARITSLQTNYQNRVIKVRIEDLYDFDPRTTDYPNRLGTALQRNGILKPYYLVIDVSVPF